MDFFFKDSIYLWEGEKISSRLRAEQQNPTQGSISQYWDHDMIRKLKLFAQPTELPGAPQKCFKSEL